MKKGFTLIELLGVLVIIGIMATIAVPALTKSLKKSKDQEYTRMVETIQMAAENYIERNRNQYPSLNEVGGVAIVTLQQLIDDALLQSPVENPKTGEILSGEYSVVAKTNTDKTITYQFYEQNAGISGYNKGTILHYDGIENGGLGQHNSKATIWRDLSGKNNDATIKGIAFDKTANWYGNALYLNDSSFNADKYNVLQNTTFSGIKSFTMEVTGAFGKITGSCYPRIFGTSGLFTDNYFLIDGLEIVDYPDTFTYNAHFSNGIAANITHTLLGNSQSKVSFSIRFNYDTKKITYFKDGAQVGEVMLTAFDSIKVSQIALAAHINPDFQYHSVRLYDKALTNQEIKQNYNVDQARFGL